MAQQAIVPKVCAESMLVSTLLPLPGQTDIDAKGPGTEYSSEVFHCLSLPAQVLQSWLYNRILEWPSGTNGSHLELLIQALLLKPPPRAGCPRLYPGGFGTFNSPAGFYNQQPDKIDCSNTCNPCNRAWRSLTPSCQFKDSVLSTTPANQRHTRKGLSPVSVQNYI